MTIIVFNRHWIIRWPWMVINLAVIAVLLSLSFWQWQRSVQKQQALAAIAQWAALRPLVLGELDPQPGANKIGDRDGASVAFSARWLAPHIWLLDNQIVNGRAGYDVLIPVQDITDQSSTHNALARNAIAIVNLGWVAAAPARNELPNIQLPADVFVQGIYRTRTDGLLLGKNLEDFGRWPMRIQKIETSILMHYLPNGLLPGVIYQQGASPFVVHYRPVVLPPERHKAYALQWLLLAVVALLVGVACAKGNDTQQLLEKDQMRRI